MPENETPTAAEESEVAAESQEASVEGSADEAPAEAPAEETAAAASADEVPAEAPAEETAAAASAEVTPAEASAEEEKEESPVQPAAEETEPEEISYHAIEKEGEITAIWEMQGRKHLRTISARSGEGQKILSLFTSEIHETDSPGISETPKVSEEASA